MFTESHPESRIGAVPTVQIAANRSPFIRRSDMLNAVTDLRHALSHDEVALEEIDAKCRERGLIRNNQEDTMSDEANELTITRENIRAIMRAAIAEGLNANRMSYTAHGYGIDRRLEDIVKTKAVDVEILLSTVLERKGKHPAWPAMVTVVEDTHRPSSYAKDFYYHDRESLEQRQPGVFAWAVRDTGTWLFIPGTGADSCLEMARAAHKTEPHEWYWWNGRDLTAVDATLALAKLADHERKLAHDAIGDQDR